MRGEDRTSGALFSYVEVEARLPARHPLRAMRRRTSAALAELDARFSALYQGIGRPSIPPERLLRASLLQLLYSLRSAAGRTAGVRHAVSLVRRAYDRRKGFRREREAAAAFSQRLPKGAPLGADKGYDAEPFVEGLKARAIEPHIAINGTVSKHGKTRKTAVPSAVAASVRYAISQRLRKRIEEGFGWTKTVGGLMQVKLRGLAKVRAAFVFAMAAYNIVRLPKLLPPRGQARPAI